MLTKSMLTLVRRLSTHLKMIKNRIKKDNQNNTSIATVEKIGVNRKT